MFPSLAPTVFPEMGLLSSKPRDVHLNLSSPQLHKSGNFGAWLTALAKPKLPFFAMFAAPVPEHIA